MPTFISLFGWTEQGVHDVITERRKKKKKKKGSNLWLTKYYFHLSLRFGVKHFTMHNPQPTRHHNSSCLARSQENRPVRPFVQGEPPPFRKRRSLIAPSPNSLVLGRSVKKSV